MANRRMFSKEIIDSDIFLDMPLSTQALYFHLSMRADDDGFVNNPKKIARMIGSCEDDAKILMAKKFILTFESGLIVIKHWKLHNYIQKDRYRKTNYTEELATLGLQDNGAYTLDTECIQNGDAGKVRKELGKVREGKVREGKESKEVIVEDEDEVLAKRTIDFLNKKANKRFGYGKGNLKEILSQIKKGATEDNLAYVINVKCQEWLNNQEHKKHLNPVTLFREANFDRYLNQEMKITQSDMISAVYEARKRNANG